MNIFQLKCFLAVSDYLNFAKAASHMNISQPSMTHQIHTLEEELQVSLFHRTTRTVELTSEGLSFLDDARNIVSISEDAIHRFSRFDEQEIVKLNIGCSSYLNPVLFVETLRLLREQHPNVHPKLQLIQGPQLQTRLENGTIDVAIHTDISVNKKSSLIYKELSKCPIVCVGPPEYLDPERSSYSLEELKCLPLVICRPTSLSPDIASLQWDLTKGRRMQDLYFCEDIESLLFLVQAGYGIAVLPDIVVPPDFCCKRFPVSVPSISFGAYYRPKQPGNIIDNFISILLQQLSQR